MIDRKFALSKAEYDTIRQSLTVAPNAAISIGTLVFNAALLCVALAFLASGSQTQYWLAQALLPVVFFQAFSLLHDCGHGSFSSRRWVNTVVGHYTSLLCFMPYFPWRYVHAEHHAWAGNVDRDPGLALVKRVRDTKSAPSVLRLGWRTGLPIGALAQHVVFWAYPIQVLRRGGMTRSRTVRCAASVVLLPSAYAGLHYAWPELFRFSNFAPALVAYLVLVELVNLPHHVGLTSFAERLPLWQQHVSTRSCRYPVGISEVFVLNFNFHIEHHLYPNLPWYRLRRAHTLVKAALGSAYRETDGFSWHGAQRRRPFLDVLLAAPSPNSAAVRTRADGDDLGSEAVHAPARDRLTNDRIVDC